MAGKETSDDRNRSLGRTCAGCGRPIASGLYCSMCLEKFRGKAKVQGKRIDAMKSKDLEKVAETRHEITIMIFVNDERNLNITKILLERGLPKYIIVAVKHPLNAINTLTSRDVTLVILDADFGGLDMLRRFREDDRFKDIPVVMMSGSTRKDLVAEIFSLGVKDYIVKPCEHKEFIDRVDKVAVEQDDQPFFEARQRNSFNILLIDDDIFDIRQERETIKHRFPCDIFTAQSAMEGMKTLESQGADLVLVSLEMPFVDGLKFLSMVKSNPKLKNIPVIIMTNTRDFAVLSEIKNSPAAGHIKKPVITEEGLALIEEKLRRRR